MQQGGAGTRHGITAKFIASQCEAHPCGVALIVFSGVRRHTGADALSAPHHHHHHERRNGHHRRDTTIPTVTIRIPGERDPERLHPLQRNRHR